MSDLIGGKPHLITLAAEIVSAYVSNNHVQSAELPNLIDAVHGAISGVSAAGRAAAAPAKATAQEIKRSVTADALISFEDGKPYKTLRRHLTLRGLTPEAYRTKWGLDPDYPMTAQTYSEQRSRLARSLGLGQQRRRTPEPGPKAAMAAAEPILAPEPDLAAGAVADAVVAEEAVAKKRRAPRKRVA